MGDIGRGGKHGFGEVTRVGRAPTAEAPRLGLIPEAPPGAEGALAEGEGEAGTAGVSTGERPALRTGERPALRTGERPALPAAKFADALTPERSGRVSTAAETLVLPKAEVPESSKERPALRTGERPALRTGERPALRTGERPALPAAKFADALTPERSGRVSTAAETLVLPKAEVPEPSSMTRGAKARELPAQQGGKAETHPDASLEAREGHTVSHMDTPIGRGGGTRIFRMPEAPGGKGQSEGKGAEPRTTGGKAPERDGFGATPTTGNRPALGDGQVRGRVLPVKELIPSSLGKLGNMEAVARRFGSDLALLHQQVRPSELPSSDRALRAWAFFTAYAEAAAAHQATPEGREHFDKALKEQGFAELRDARTGNDGVKSGQWVLESSHPEEARARAEQVHLEPPPEVLLSESAQLHEAPRKPEEPPKPRNPAQEAKDTLFAKQPERQPLERVEGHSEFVHVNPQHADAPRPIILPAAPQKQGLDQAPEALRDALHTLGNWKKLGSNMLWNVLHRFRGEGEDSAVEKEKWDRLTFGAVLALAGMMLLVILLVSL